MTAPKGSYGWFITASKQYAKIAGSTVSLVALPFATKFDTQGQAQAALTQLGLGADYAVVDRTIAAEPTPTNNTTQSVIPTQEQLREKALAAAKPHSDALTASRLQQRRYGGNAKLVPAPSGGNPPATSATPVNNNQAASASSVSPQAGSSATQAAAAAPSVAVLHQPTAKRKETTNRMPGGNLHALALRIKADQDKYNTAAQEVLARLDQVEPVASQAFIDAHQLVSGMQTDAQDLHDGIAALAVAASPPTPAASSSQSVPASSPAVTVEAAAVAVAVPMPPIATPVPVAVAVKS